MNRPFYVEGLSRHNLEAGSTSGVAQVALAKYLGNVLALSEVDQSSFTIAMIRPELETSSRLSGDDEEIADSIEMNISALGIAAKFSVSFDDDTVELFYGGDPKEAQSKVSPQRRLDLDTRWDEFKAMMTGGPTTILLLHNPDGSAISSWRNQVGHWNIEKNRDPSTIRGKFGLDNYNNLVHGSDSVESVKRELQIIVEYLMKNTDSIQ